MQELRAPGKGPRGQASCHVHGNQRAVSDYQPRHAKHASQDELPAILRGLADLIQIVDSEETTCSR